MNEPVIVTESSFQEAWKKAIIKLSENHWQIWNLMVQIKDPRIFDMCYHQRITKFAKNHNIIEPNQVAYTIFPFKLYKPSYSREFFYHGYWKYFEMTRHMPHSGWGTYFERMIRYPISNHRTVDQLGTIIDNIRNREKNYGASYVIIIPEPEKDLKRIMGGPCLNNISIQVEIINDRKVINLLSVYRNHNFLERAYGNYYGLCKLLEYIASESESEIGGITCISSRAQVENYKSELLAIAKS